jgi:hypothetical protein
MMAKRSITQNLFRWIFFLWIGIWGLFWVRPFFIGKSEFTKNLRLFRLSFEERREVVYGRDLYRFLRFCKSQLPVGSRYRIVGLESLSLDFARAVYDLYPCLLSGEPEYLLVYKQPQFLADHFERSAFLDQDSFILKVQSRTP